MNKETDYTSTCPQCHSDDTSTDGDTRIRTCNACGFNDSVIAWIGKLSPKVESEIEEAEVVKKPLVITPSLDAFICGNTIIPYSSVKAVQENNVNGPGVAICLNGTDNVAFLNDDEVKAFVSGYTRYLNADYNKTVDAKIAAYPLSPWLDSDDVCCFGVPSDGGLDVMSPADAFRFVADNDMMSMIALRLPKEKWEELGKMKEGEYSLDLLKDYFIDYYDNKSLI